MKIVDIFAVVEGSLYAVQFEGEEFDEFEKLRNTWKNQEFLSKFFRSREHQLKYFNLSAEQASLLVIEERKYFFKRLLNAAQLQAIGNSQIELDSIFEALNDNEFSLKDYQKSKYKYKFLRLYAVRVETLESSSIYIISGGGIKLVKRMQEDELLQKELEVV